MPHPFTGGTIDAYLAEHNRRGGGVTSNVDVFGQLGLNADQAALARSLVGQPGANGIPLSEFDAAAQVAALFGTGPLADEPGGGFPPPAPPAFSGTQAGLTLQAQLQGQLQTQAEAASLKQAQLQATTQTQITRLQESGAFRRLQSRIGADKAIAQFEASEAFRRQVLSEVGAGARAEIEQAGAFRRTLLSELGAGARGDVEAFTTQRGQSIGAVQDTFSRLSDLATQPSDFRRLAFNVEGIQPPGATATDTLRDRMAQFFQQQLDVAGQQPQSFADIFGQAQEQIPIPEAQSFADVFNQTRQDVGVPGPARLQFGGRASGAAIVGEKGPELVFNPDNVISSLTKGEMMALKAGGVRGRQFGVTSNVPPSRLGGRTLPTGPTGIRQNTLGLGPTDVREVGPVQATDFQGLNAALQGPLNPPPGQGTDFQAVNAALLNQIKPSEPFFNTIASGQSPAFSPSVFNTPGFTASGFRAPTLPSFRQFNQLLPFQREQLFGAFGENVFSPQQFLGQGFDPLTATPQRPGIDAGSLLAAIRRFSPIGNTQALTRFG